MHVAYVGGESHLDLNGVGTHRSLVRIFIASLPTEIRLGESTERLLAHVATALGQLQHVPDRELAADWRRALQKLRRFLIDADETTVSDLQDENLLQPIVDALRDR